ncbi:Myc-type basic helix-loop-helix (bHLH) domain [Arabidopsis thaliana x Arabidopsis arenosa]|uniref:Myc-type basic helix-loop-helix (BHLH) domain n=1 Tax=Arabidopsis thaliana x Arabidopsis arenosa TaxID=1240361 RepID=A0A8T1YB98_9BRAS|nr:Myc-type basic helix-loop-helix (bHLH) domain [Arabidopsis thaliana x Arabidopsis arenosa]
MYPSLDDDDFVSDLFCFDQSNGAELDDYTQFGVNLQHDQEDTFPDFVSYGVNLQQEPEEVFSIGAAQLDLSSYNGVLSQEPEHVGQKDCGIVQEDEVEINSGSSGGAVKQEQEHLDDDCSRKRARTGSCSRGGGTKACRERMRREKLNERFMDLSSVLEPGRTPKTDKPAILDDAIRILNQLRDEAHKLEETNQKLLEEIKSLKAEKNELREEKLVLKADKEKTEQQLKSMTVPSSGFMPQIPAAFNHNKMAVYPSYGYMPMWHYMPQSVRDTSHDQELRPPAA